MNLRNCRIKGASTIKTLLAVPGLLLVALLFAFVFCEARKAYWDYQVREMCAKDGGIKVYETVKLPPDKFNEWGQVKFDVRMKGYSQPGEEYYYEWDIQHYHEGNPEVWRNHFILYHVAEKKMVGEALGYNRRGGDFPGPWHESSFGCPHDGNLVILKQHVFKSANKE